MENPMPKSGDFTDEWLLARLSNTHDPEACWEWQWSRRNGYGKIAVCGPDKTRWLSAHRAAYEMFVGSIPEGHDVCHTCDNPPCCNPAHLFAGTVADNMKDAIAKGRRVMPKGSAHGRAKMTETMVIEIRRLWATGSKSQLEIAAQFGVHPQRVCSVVNRRTWKHV